MIYRAIIAVLLALPFAGCGGSDEVISPATGGVGVISGQGGSGLDSGAGMGGTVSGAGGVNSDAAATGDLGGQGVTGGAGGSVEDSGSIEDASDGDGTAADSGATDDAGGWEGDSGAAGDAGDVGGDSSVGGGRTDFILGSPETIADGEYRPTRIELDANYIYWSNLGTFDETINGALRRQARTGGPTETVVEDTTVNAITLSETHVYWGSMQSDYIRRLPKGGGDSELIAQGDLWPGDLAIVGNWLYYSSWSRTTGGLSRVPIDGGDTEVIVDTGPLTFVTVDGDWLYMTELNQTFGEARLLSRNLNTNEQTVLADQRGEIWYSAFDSKYIYFADGGLRTVSRVDKVTGAVVDIVDRQIEPYGVAVDAVNLYWTNRGGDNCEGAYGNVMMKPLDSDEVTVLASGLSCPNQIVVDDVGLYWVNEGAVASPAGGSVQWIAKL